MPENISGVPAGRSVFHLTSPLIGQLFRAINVYDSMHTLLQKTHTAIPHVSAVVVVTEENCPAHKILRPNRDDYRTDVGDRGVGLLQQRVHGVVDVYGA